MVHALLPGRAGAACSVGWRFGVISIGGNGACVYRKLDSAILVVKATENWICRDGTEALNRAMERRVLVQGAMGVASEN